MTDTPQGQMPDGSFQHLQLTADKQLQVYLAGALATLNLDLDMEPSDIAAAILAAISGMPVDIDEAALATAIDAALKATNQPTSLQAIAAGLVENGGLKVSQGLLTPSDTLNAISKKGAVGTALNAVTATTTSATIDLSAAANNGVTYNALLIDVNVTSLIAGSWDIYVHGNLDNDWTVAYPSVYSASGGSFILNAPGTSQFQISSALRRTLPILQIPDFIRIRAVLNIGPGTITVKYQPFTW